MIDTKHKQIISILTEQKKKMWEDINNQYSKISKTYDKLSEAIIALTPPEGIIFPEELKPLRNAILKGGVNKLSKLCIDFAEFMISMSKDIDSINLSNWR